jgi:BirA family biotin operon repressor/biotin-[acetyl-CoA-carboxylase] ligase
MNASRQVIGHPFIELQAVDSTNNYATALLHEGLAQHGTAVLAHCQTAGRGQRNRTWLTGSGGNIAMSIVVVPVSLNLSQMFGLSMAAAIGVHRCFNRHAKGNTFIKWPNDLYWNDRKAGGILIENSLTATHWKHAVIGIGVNINELAFGALATRAVSLRQVTGLTFDVAAIAREMCDDLEWAYALLLQDRAQVEAIYHEHLYKRNASVRLKCGPRTFTTTIKGVNPTGQLVTQSAMEEVFDVGEVEWPDLISRTE